MNTSLKIYLTSFLILILFAPVAHAKNTPDKPFTVIIDPGHGGKDPGAVFKQIKEKDIVLNIGLKLGQYIKENLPDVKVVYTRDKDVFVPLHRRADIANKSKADLFISLHANYCGTPAITGTETFVLGLHRTEENLEVAKKENAVILMEDDYSSTYQGFDPNSSESYIMFEMVQDEHLTQSIDVAAAIQGQFKNRAGRKDRGVKQAGFLVLRRTSMPSVLVEAGFLSNNGEANYMKSSTGQSHLASAIYRAVRDYKKAIDNKSNYKLVAQTTQELAQETIKQPETPPTPTVKTSNTDIFFSIQLAASGKKLATAPYNFKGLKEVQRKQVQSIYKYYYGKTSSFESIKQLRNQVKSLYPDAFIVAFEGEKPISINKALRKLKP
ncbi:N-acetylmuramoyl-L-alanine amidase family protein [Sunxiuqinia elliptica]|uniref:N-acetylmuramoyl-L-alanine amidase n=1 Tax=Sunxiuqinia elliptica TaxID=655355 RepID=A0A1I2JAZ6_9BACT|nr:N-acetylmuramoyl-L-alanine amidase [Sunxiuqinia elliptica]SFF51489.1 N-acetylmuramoyl-L-alanine amidase [Sunxiuqinia elliptica]